MGSGVVPILFNPNTLTWRVPTMFMVSKRFPVLCVPRLNSIRFTPNINVKACLHVLSSPSIVMLINYFGRVVQWLMHLEKHPRVYRRMRRQRRRHPMRCSTSICTIKCLENYGTRVQPNVDWSTSVPLFQHRTWSALSNRRTSSSSLENQDGTALLLRYFHQSSFEHGRFQSHPSLENAEIIRLRR